MRAHRRSGWILLACGVLAGAAYLCARTAVGPPRPVRPGGAETVETRLRQYGEAARRRWSGDFARSGVSYPPAAVTLAAFKAERKMEVWAAGKAGGWRLLRTYPIQAASGRLGPKLREGDRQVPEGVYAIESLNPNSLYHLSLRVGYPDAEDLRHARAEGRARPGGDIMIHGGAASVGCLAMGDEAAEDLFVLAADAGVGAVTLLACPVDFRMRDLPADMPPVPAWMPERYARLRAALAGLKQGGE